MIRILPLMLLLLSGCDAPGRSSMPDYPDADSPDFQIFARHCSQCHAPPQPSAHTRAEWPNVVARMQQHRVQRSLPPIPASDIARLRTYLEAHAATEGN